MNDMTTQTPPASTTGAGWPQSSAGKLRELWTYWLVCLAVVLAYTLGLLEDIGLVELLGKLMLDAPLSILLLLALPPLFYSRDLPGRWLFFCFCGWTLFSALVTGTQLYVALLWPRYLIFGYAFFVIAWSGILTWHHVRSLMQLVFWLWVLQIVAAGFEVLVLGEHVEAHVGTMTRGGGGLAVDFPLMSMIFVLSVYLFHRARFATGFLAGAFLLVAYASGKRAIYFYVPAVVAGLILEYIVVSLHCRARVLVPLLHLILLLALTLPIFLVGMDRSGGLGEAITESGAGAGIVKSAVEFAMTYTTTESEEGLTMGRTATSLGVLRRLHSSDWFVRLYGIGPGALRDDQGDISRRKYFIGYGCTGWAEDAIVIGWPGVLFRVLFFVSMWRAIAQGGFRRLVPFWRGMAVGAQVALVALVLLYFTYSSGSVIYPQILLVLFFVCGLISSPHYQPFFDAREPPWVAYPAFLPRRR